MDEQVTNEAREKAEYATLRELVRRTTAAKREIRFLLQEIEDESTEPLDYQPMEDLVDRALAEIKVYRVAADEAAKLHIQLEAAGKVKGWRAYVTNKDQRVHPFHEWIAKRKALYQPGSGPRLPHAYTAAARRSKAALRSHSHRTVCG